jgi:hypothetical protein
VARPPFDPYSRPFYAIAILGALAAGALVYAVTQPNNAGLAITATFAAATLLIGVGTFRYNQSSLDISPGGVVVDDVPKVRITARVRGPRAIKLVAVEVYVGDVWRNDLWDPEGVISGLGEKLDHAGELIVDFRRDQLVEATGRD